MTQKLKSVLESIEHIVGKEENVFTMFSTLSEREIVISATFILPSANALNLEQSKMLLFGKGLNEGLFDKGSPHYHMVPFVTYLKSAFAEINVLVQFFTKKSLYSLPGNPDFGKEAF